MCGVSNDYDADTFYYLFWFDVIVIWQCLIDDKLYAMIALIHIFTICFGLTYSFMFFFH